MSSKSQFSHMWVNWLKNCDITFNLHDKLLYSAATNNSFQRSGLVVYTVARIMSITLKIGIWGGWLTPQLEKKFKLLYPYRNTWMHQIQFINANNCHASANVFTIYSIFWIWMLRIGPASRNKILVFCCQYLAFLQSFWH